MCTDTAEPSDGQCTVHDVTRRRISTSLMRRVKQSHWRDVLATLSTAVAGLRGVSGDECEPQVKTLASGRSALNRTELETRRAISPLTLRTE